MLWRLASAWGDSPPRNSCTTWRLNSIECVRCLAMGFLLESPVQLADSQGPYLSTSKGALQSAPTPLRSTAPLSILQERNGQSMAEVANPTVREPLACGENAKPAR